MKKFTLAMTILVMACTFVTSSFTRAKAQDVSVSFQTFYDELSPYGQWVYDADYGNVFVPNVDQGFRPYANEGRWVLTDNGNMWQSDYAWGWACFHYGRWTYNSYYGWVWIPGYEWAPAWVSWRSGGGYYGWAPMGPGYVVGRPNDYPENYWVFVGPQYLYSPRVYSYYDAGYQDVFIRRSSYIHETYYENGSHVSYHYGPRAEVIERETHHPVEVYRVNNSSTVGESRMGHREVNIYRPAVNRERSNDARPSNVVRAERPVGRPETYSTEHRQTEFHQNVQRQAPAEQHGNNQPNHNQPEQHGNNQPNHNQPEQHGNNQPQQHPQQQPGNQPQQHPQPGNQPQQHPQQQPGNQPQQHPQHQPGNQPQQHPQQQPGNQPQQHPQQQPGNQPQQHPQQQPGNQPQQHPQQQPANQPQQHQQPQQQQPRPQPQQQQPRPQAQPQPQRSAPAPGRPAPAPSHDTKKK